MRVIALMNQKGGVGKTTTCANLGAALAESGARVCLIDVDPQSHLSINFGHDAKDGDQTLYDLLTGHASFLECVRQIGDRLAILPGSIDLAAVESELAGVANRQTILRRAMLQAQHEFDYILLDCPPSLGLLTLNALAAATEVLIPMQPHFLALQGFAKLLETTHLMSRQINPTLSIAGIVLTMFDSQTKLSSEVVSELENFLTSARGKRLPWSESRIFKTRIRRNIKLAEAPSFGQPITQYDSSSNGATDYRALAAEIALMRVPVASEKPEPAKLEVTLADDLSDRRLAAHANDEPVFKD
jgi:chromosome partitioning protein